MYVTVRNRQAGTAICLIHVMQDCHPAKIVVKLHEPRYRQGSKKSHP